MLGWVGALPDLDKRNWGESGSRAALTGLEIMGRGTTGDSKALGPSSFSVRKSHTNSVWETIMSSPSPGKWGVSI